MIFTAFTFLRNFAKPSVLLVLAGMLLAGIPAWYFTRAASANRIADLKVELAKERERQAQVQADALVRASELVRKAEDAERLRERAMLDGIAQGQQAVSGQVSRLSKLMQETTNDPTFDCRRLALPRAYLDGLQRGAR